jgi:hypothetical protein
MARTQIAVADVLEHALQLLRRRGGWVKGASRIDRPEAPQGSAKVQFCAVGALSEAVHQMVGTTFAAGAKEDKVRIVAGALLLHTMQEQYPELDFHDIVDFNDADRTRKQDVVRVFEKTYLEAVEKDIRI